MSAQGQPTNWAAGCLRTFFVASAWGMVLVGTFGVLMMALTLLTDGPGPEMMGEPARTLENKLSAMAGLAGFALIGWICVFLSFRKSGKSKPAQE